MIHRRVAHVQQISWRVLVAGRLLQVKLHLPTPVHILAVYQKAWASTGSQRIMQQRAKLWDALDRELPMISSNHYVMCLGDFNADICPTPGVAHTGPTQRGPGAAILRADSECLAQIASKRNLVALNACTAWEATFCGSMGLEREANTRIDFVFLSRQHADTASRQCGPGTRSPLNLRRGGTYHLPLIASVPSPPQRWRKPVRTQPFTTADV